MHVCFELHISSLENKNLKQLSQQDACFSLIHFITMKSKELTRSPRARPMFSGWYMVDIFDQWKGSGQQATTPFKV